MKTSRSLFGHSAHGPVPALHFSPARGSCSMPYTGASPWPRQRPLKEPAARPDALFASVMEAQRQGGVWEDAIFTLLGASGAAAVALSML